ncbi:MAG TPA: serine hydrolase [Pyrinomonadaceae bacterium]|jgi:CubicO group peptidase (beta-lactamase class C family)
MNTITAGIRRAAAVAALSLLVAVSCAAQTAAPAPEWAAQVDDYLSGLAKQNRFSGAVLVARDGRVLLSKGYGFANAELEVPNMPQTKFRLGSITKQFTAASILLLQERGKLDVQDSVCKYVENCPAAWQPVTIHHLLTHTSGIPSFTGFPDYLKTMALPTTIPETLARFRDKPLEFKPGEQFSYSNSGYVLLGHLVEKVSGKSYADFLRENVFVPLGMTNTGADVAGQILKGRASGYRVGADGLSNAPYLDMSIPHGAGALYSTVEDLYLWEQGLFGGKLLAKKSLDAMLTVVKDYYGYGIGVDTQFKLARIGHSGGINGFNTYMAWFPDERATFIVLSNIENGTPATQIETRLARLALADKIVMPPAAKVDAAALASYAGRYELDPKLGNIVFDVTAGEGGLLIKPSHSDRHKFVPVSETEFYDFDDGGDVRFIFQKNEKNEVTGITIRGVRPTDGTARKLSLPAPSVAGNTTFELKGYSNATIVALAGTFNSWNQSQTLCAREAGEWICRLDLKPGKYAYKFVVDGNWITDPANPENENDGQGNINSVLVKGK